MPYDKKFSNLEYKRFRVKSAVRSFRDLEVYRKTNQFAAEIYKIELPKSFAGLKSEFDSLKNIAKSIPELIAESYGDKFSDLALSLGKLEKAAQVISGVITRIDFLALSADEVETRETLNKLLRQYQIQRVKILNLKRAWMRVFGEMGKVEDRSWKLDAGSWRRENDDRRGR